ncbi:hypothetical protein FBY26_1050 [Phycicoccus sp. SLBN-51]|nr:hypothetical protein FBY26_1050 [Phycicoccus sp. SLBN-51]
MCLQQNRFLERACTIVFTIVSMTMGEQSIRVVPVNEVSWGDLEAVFGVRGAASRCQYRPCGAW